jgi:WD40 repeat protein/transcriptional regulator with XRE-family HTH domain
MPTSIPQSTLEKFTTFGDLLRFLRRHAGITQLELSIAVGYSTAQICRLEQNLRLPDPPTIEARIVPALYLEDEPRAVARLMELAANVRREDAPEPGMSPYKGLEYFDEADAGLFVGREALTARLAERVLSFDSKKAAADQRFFAIVGASGSGKSSLVRAGLVPALRWDKRSANWQIHVLTPTAHPLESLATALSQENGSAASITSMMDDLQKDPRHLGIYIKRELKDIGASHLVLVIDQFEELFSLCRSEEERSAFIDNLLTASSDGDGQAIVVITLRADFYAHCASYPQLRQALARQQEYIGAMSDEEMRRAIEEPARRGRWEFEEGLVDLILHDVGHEPGALPLLSHALLETWQRRHGHMLTLSGYTSAGGVRGAIAETAESVFTDQFTHAQQVIAKRIFLRLTELGDETATGDTRRRATFNELILKPEESEATQAVLNALVEARLVTTSEDCVEVAHEALIREWPTLRGWLEDNREGLRLHRQLTDAAQDWQAAEREPDLLFRGVRLGQAREWAAAHSDDLNVLEREFLEASFAAGEREAAEREAQHRRELESAQKLAEAESRRAEEQGHSARRLRRRAIYLGLALGFTFILVVVAIVFARQSSLNAVRAGYQQSTAQAASLKAISEANTRATAQANALAQQSLAEAASTQAIDEANIRATAEAKAVVEAALNRSLSLAGSAQLANQSGEGDTALALAMEAVNLAQPPPEASAALRKVAMSPGTRFILNGHTKSVSAIAISPDNQRAFSGSCTHLNTEGKCLSSELILWDLDARKELHRWSAHTGWVNAVAFSLDGQILVSGGEAGSVILWDARSGNEIRQLTGHTKNIIGLAVTTEFDTPNPSLFSGSADGTLILHDLKTGDVLQKFDQYNSTLTSLAVASKGNRAVTGYQDGSLILWDLNNIHPVRKINVDGVAIFGLAISTDGSLIYSTAGGTLRMIDSQSGSVVKEAVSGGIPNRLVLYPDEKHALVEFSYILTQWDITNWQEQQMLYTDAGEWASPLAISPDGRLAATGYSNGTLHFWNLATLDYQTFNTGLSFPDSIAITPDGQSLLLGNAFTSQQSLVCWDIAGSRKIIALNDIVTDPDSIAFSSDGHFAAAVGGTQDFGVTDFWIWSLPGFEVACHIYDPLIGFRSLAISPDNRFVLTGSQIDFTNTLVLWDVQSCQEVRRFDLDPDEDVTGIAFSSDGKLAITGTAYFKRIILWDVNTGHEIKRFPFENAIGKMPILDVAFVPDDRTILATFATDLVLLDVGTGAIIRRYYGHSANVWSVDISTDDKYILSGANNGEVILWDFSTGEELARLQVSTQPVTSVKFSPDGNYAYFVTGDGLLVKWKIPVQHTLPELLDWINNNRYVRPLTCEERQRYRVEPLCEQESP